MHLVGRQALAGAPDGERTVAQAHQAAFDAHPQSAGTVLVEGPDVVAGQAGGGIEGGEAAAGVAEEAVAAAAHEEVAPESPPSEKM